MSNRPIAGAFTESFTDFDKLAAFFNGWEGQFAQLSTGRFEGRLQVVNGSQLRFVSVAFNQTIHVRGHANEGCASIYLVHSSNAAGLWQGRRLDPGQLVVHGPDASTDHRSARSCQTLGLSLPSEELMHAVRVLTKSHRRERIPTWSVVSPSPDAAAALGRRAQRVIQMGHTDRSWLQSYEGMRAEEDCLRAMIDAVLAPRNEFPSRESLPVRAALVRRAEELMRARIQEPMGAMALCEAVGASDRTLRLAFRERYGMGPMAYFKTLRLNAVRDALKRETTGHVAIVARRFGFHHLGNFAADYRRLFGSPPSQTNGRKVGEMQV